MGKKGKTGQYTTADKEQHRKKDSGEKASGKRGELEQKNTTRKNARTTGKPEKREQALRQKHGIEKIEWSQEEREKTQAAPFLKHKPRKNSSASNSNDRGGEKNRQRHGQHRYGNKYGIRTGSYLGYQEDERGGAAVSAAEHTFSENGETAWEKTTDQSSEHAAAAEAADTMKGPAGSSAGAVSIDFSGDSAGDSEEEGSRIEGRNAVTEAYRAGRTIDRLYMLEGCEDGPIMTIKRMAAKEGTPIRYVSRQRLDQMSETGSHQGVIASVAAYHYGTIEELFGRAQEKNEDPFFIILDNIEDPYNLGAIIRTANVAGAHGVIIAKDRAVGLTATVAKASAGAINYTPVVRVTNISQTIEELKKKGLWFVCADMDGQPMTRLNLAGPIGLVIGAEGAGVSRLVKERCDIVASIPQHGEINSLNASVAAGILSYEILRQRMK